MVLLDSIYIAAEALGAELYSQAELPAQLQNAPPFIREYHKNIFWPLERYFTGPEMDYGEDINLIAMHRKRIVLVDWLDDHDDEIETGNQYEFGSTGGGNYTLLLKEFDPNPTNPMVYKLDHEQTYDAFEVCGLLEFFSNIVPSE